MPRDPKDTNITDLIAIAKSKGQTPALNMSNPSDWKNGIYQWAQELELLPGSAQSKATTVYEAYLKWVEEKGMPPASLKGFGNVMTSMYPKRRMNDRIVYLLNKVIEHDKKETQE